MKTIITILIILFLASCAPPPQQIYNPQPVYASIISGLERDLYMATTPEEAIRIKTTLTEVRLRRAEAMERQGVRQDIQKRQPTIFDQLFNVAVTTAIIGGITKAIWN